MFSKNASSYLRKNIEISKSMVGKYLNWAGSGNKMRGTLLTGVAAFGGYHGGKFGLNLRNKRRSRGMIDDYFEDVKRNPMKHSFS